LKVLLVNLLAALNFANVFQKTLRNVKNVTKIKKNVKKRFLHLWTSRRTVSATAELLVLTSVVTVFVLPVIVRPLTLLATVLDILRES